MVCDLMADPKETIDLMQSHLTYAWVIGAATAPLIALGQSAAQFPHIKVGEEDSKATAKPSRESQGLAETPQWCVASRDCWSLRREG